MYKLYDTDKELFFNKDYKPLPDLYSLNCTELVELRANLYDALENAFINGASMLETALSTDVVKIQKHMAFQYILTVSPGHLSTVICSTKYRDIDNAVHAAWDYFSFDCTDDEYIQIGNDPAAVEALIIKAYKSSKHCATA